MDYEVTGWDGNTKAGAKLLRSDLAAEDPVLLTTSFPCSPWCGASRINLAIGGQNADTVRRLREEARPHLALVAK
eukprot:3927201-Alexandrium_andersonii.AAC.1